MVAHTAVILHQANVCYGGNPTGLRRAMPVAGLYVARSVEPRGALMTADRAPPEPQLGSDSRTLTTFGLNSFRRDTGS